MPLNLESHYDPSTGMFVEGFHGWGCWCFGVFLFGGVATLVLRFMPLIWLIWSAVGFMVRCRHFLIPLLILSGSCYWKREDWIWWLPSCCATCTEKCSCVFTGYHSSVEISPAFFLNKWKIQYGQLGSIYLLKAPYLNISLEEQLALIQADGGFHHMVFARMALPFARLSTWSNSAAFCCFCFPIAEILDKKRWGFRGGI